MGEGAGVDSDDDEESSSEEFLLVFLLAFVLVLVEVFFSRGLLTVFRTVVGFLGLSFFSAGFSFLLPSFLSSLEVELEEPESLDADPLSLSLELSDPRSEPLEDPLDDPLELESDVSSIF